MADELYQIKIDNKIYGVQDQTARTNLATEITNRGKAIEGVQKQIMGVQTALIGATTDATNTDTINGVRNALADVQTALQNKDAELLGSEASTSSENSIHGLRAYINKLIGTNSETLETINKIKAELTDPSDTAGLTSFLDKVSALIAGFQTDSSATIKNYIDTQDAGVQSALIGTTADAADADTINGVRKALAGVQSQLTGVQSALEAGVQGVKQTIENNEQVVAASLNDLEDRKANKQDVDTAIAGVQSRIDTLDTANNNIQEKTLNYVTNVTYKNGVLEITTGTAKVLEYKTSTSNS